MIKIIYIIKEIKMMKYDEDRLSLELIEAQYQLLKNKNLQQGKSLLILVSGIELAGKGRAVKQLREWLDPRHLRVQTLPPQLIQANQPIWLRYTPELPAIGQITVMFGAWYSDLFATVMHASKPFDHSLYKDYIKKIAQFEQDLVNNHIDVVKIWFDLSWKTLQKRLDEIDTQHLAFEPLHGIDWRNKKHYDTLQKLRKQLTNDWYVIDGEQRQHCHQHFAEYILQRLQQPYRYQSSVQYWQAQPIHYALEKIRQTALGREQYKAEIKSLSKKVANVLRNEQRNVVIVFEGMDASGKGGAIKRIIKHLDPREYTIHSISAPEQYELRRPYLWRFWTRLQKGRKIQIFDRSWYGRVLVERIEGFAKAEEWQRAYQEINRFERDLSESNTIVIKFWLAISLDEQEKRFHLRQSIPHKRFKITDEDWRNRDKWQDYLSACSDMLHYTSPKHARWQVINTDDKYTARIEILTEILKQLGK